MSAPNKPTVVPLAWPGVFLAAVPGVLMTLSRFPPPEMGPVLSVAAIGYAAVLFIGIAVAMIRDKHFPVWALMPAGAAVWLAAYVLGNLLAELGGPFNPLGDGWLMIILLNAVAAALLFALAWRAYGRQTATAPSLVLLLVVSTLLLVLVTVAGLRSDSGRLPYLVGGLAFPIEMLMLLAAGSLAARQHGVLADLVIIGGLTYMLADSDYLWGYWLRGWAGYQAYIAAMTALFLVVVPVVLLRARTQAGRALALFVPVLVFVVARIVVPQLVLRGEAPLPLGDVFLSLMIPLTLLVGWWLYGRLYDPKAGQPATDLPAVVASLS